MPLTSTQPRRHGSTLLLVDALAFVAALADHTSQHPAPALPSIQNLPMHRALEWHLHGNDATNLRQMLLTAWQAEAELYSASTGFVFNTEADCAKWFLGQARESVASTQRAFLQIHGVPATVTPGLIRREVGRLVVRNAYPRWLSCYAAGPYNDYSVHRLPQFTGVALPHYARQKDAQSLVGLALMTHRNNIAHQTRASVQANENTAIRSSFDGGVIEHFHKEHWDQLTWRLGYTTIFDVLNDAVVPERVNAKQLLDFQRHLAHVVGVINDVHECYVRKILGPAAVAELRALAEGYAFLLPRWQ